MFAMYGVEGHEAKRTHLERRAFSLLEVLVSLGVLVAALGGVAALLPAAASRVGDATALDRAGALAANARADLLTRGILKASIFPSTQKAVVFGEGLAGVGGAVPALTTAPKGVFFSPDDPNGSMCYGCMVLNMSDGDAAVGGSARVMTAVFERVSSPPAAFQVEAVGGGSVYRLKNSGHGPAAVGLSATEAATAQKRFFQGCSWVIAVGGGKPPQWHKISASWSALKPGTRSDEPAGSYISLQSSIDSACGCDSTFDVFGFDNLLLVSERVVVLE